MTTSTLVRHSYTAISVRNTCQHINIFLSSQLSCFASSSLNYRILTRLSDINGYLVRISVIDLNQKNKCSHWTNMSNCRDKECLSRADNRNTRYYETVRENDWRDLGPIHTKDARFFCCGNSAVDISKPHTFKWDPLADEVLEAA